MKHLRILIVENEDSLRETLKLSLASFGSIIDTRNYAQARLLISSHAFDLALIDLNLDENSDVLQGLKIIKECKIKGITPIVFSGEQGEEAIQSSFEAGCHYYFSKTNVSQVLETQIIPLIESRLNNRNLELIQQQYPTKNKIFLDNILHILKATKNPNQRVLITGPTGVGKTQFAKFIHQTHEENRPFVHINLNEIPENLLESTLFGHKKGAFTDAHEDRKGLLEQANGGTLFLDEIGVMPLTIQKKLLRVIEEKCFTPLGCNEMRRSSFRLISASCDEMGPLIEKNMFRLDFYFRIKGVELNVPPLSERKEDIVPLIHYFLQKSPQKLAFHTATINVLKNYKWYGNIRELKSLIDGLLETSEGLIQVEQLPEHIQQNENPFGNIEDKKNLFSPLLKNYLMEYGLPALVKAIETEAITMALKENHGKINEVGRKLKVSKSVLYRILKDIEKEEKPQF